MLKIFQIDAPSRDRIQWINVSRGIFMFFVIMCHSGYVPALYDRIYSPFFITGFFFLSGYLFHNPEKEFKLSFKLIRIVETILIPYLVYWILSYSIEHLIKGDFYFFSQLAKNILRGNKLWFISALFCSQIMFSLFLAINKAPKYAVIFSVVSLLIWYFTPLSNSNVRWPWCFNNAMMANFFLGLGYFIKSYQFKFISFIENNKVGLFLSIIYVLLVLFNWLYLKNEMNFPANRFGEIWVFVLYAFIGICFVFYLSNKFKRFNWLFVFIGENSLLYYFFQNQILKVLKVIMSKFSISSPDYIIPILMTVAVAVILIIPILLVKKYFPIMTGKNKLLSQYLFRN